MTKIEEAIGRDLDDATVRAELWLALRMSSMV
jgi:DNA-binding PucR family transcriptional regulator